MSRVPRSLPIFMRPARQGRPYSCSTGRTTTIPGPSGCSRWSPFRSCYCLTIICIFNPSSARRLSMRTRRVSSRPSIRCPSASPLPAGCSGPPVVHVAIDATAAPRSQSTPLDSSDPTRRSHRERRDPIIHPPATPPDDDHLLSGTASPSWIGSSTRDGLRSRSPRQSPSAESLGDMS